MTPRVSPTRSKSARDMRREGQWGLWLVRILFASMLLLKHKYTQQQTYRAPAGCPASASLDDFWSAMQWFALMYFVVDFGSCFFFACSSIWIRQSLSYFGRSLSCVTVMLASWGIFLYSRAFAFHIRCAGIFGVIVMLFFFVFVVFTVIWCLMVECDFCLDTGGNESTRCWLGNPFNCCRVHQLFCNLDAWPIPPIPSSSVLDLEKGDASPVRCVQKPSPPTPDTSSGRGMRSSPGSGSNHERITFRVIGRQGEVLFASRTKQTVRTWIKRNLDREKRRGVMIEERPRSKRSMKKRLSPSSAF